MSKVSWIITDHHVIVGYEGQRHMVARDQPLADRVIKALKDGKNDDIPALVDAAKRVESFSQGHFTIQDGEVFVKGVAAPRVLGEKIVKFSKEGLPYQPLVRFAEKLQQNPSFRAVNELYGFLSKNDHALTDEGNFIAYKRVRKDFKDIHSGTFDNTPGQSPEMPRNQVNEDPNQTCSEGLHVANWDYAHTQFASSDPSTDVMLEVEVNPADVVSIPVDYNNSKMRVCKYKVLSVVTTPFTGSSLRKTEFEAPTRVTDGFSSANNPEEPQDDGEECDSCGANAVYDGVCDECDYEKEEDEDFCDYCGESYCFGECQDEEEDEDEDEDEEEDKYPWDDEV